MKIISTLFLVIFAAAGVLAIPGCASYSDDRQAARHEYDAASARMGQIDSMTQPLVEHNSGVWLPQKARLFDEKPALPAAFSKSASYTTTEMPFGTVISDITHLSGIRIFVTDDAVRYLSVRSGSADSASSGGPSVAPPSPVMPSATPSLTMGPGSSNSMAAVDANSSGEGVSGLTDLRVDLDYRGTLQGLFDTLASSLNVSWRWDDRHAKVIIFRNETKTFVINAPAGNISMATSMTTQADSSGEGSSVNNRHAVTSELVNLSPWEGLRGTVQAAMSSSGALSISESAGTLTVSDAPIVLSRIADIVDEFNDRMGQQVALRVEIYDVVASRGSEYGIDWSLVYQNAASAGITFNTDMNGANTNMGTMGITIARPTSPWVDSQALVKAIADQADVSVVLRTNTVTLSGQPVPIQNINDRGYIKQVSSVVTGELVEVTAEQDTVRDGTSITLLPRVINHKKILMQYFLDLSTLNSIDTEQVGENSVIQMPNKTSKQFSQTVSLTSGSTLVLTGFNETERSARHSGYSELFLPGANRRNAKRERMTLIMITPFVMTSGS